jgi:simple sugar transport system permease protein
LFGRHAKLLTLLVILIVLVVIMSVALPTKFLRLLNFQSMVSQIPEFGLLTIAMMIAMITGGIDLSVVSITNLTGVIAALILKNMITPAMSGVQAFSMMALAVFAAVALSAVCGLLNGVVITKFGVPAILATLGTQGMYIGIAIAITEGHGISTFPEKFLFIGAGMIGFVPMPFVIFVVIAFLSYLFLTKTKLGLSMYMVGSNPTVSKFAGINNDDVLIKTYITTGLLAGVSSIIMISRVNSMRPGYGYAYLLQAILVVILGGVDPYGGFGSVLGVVMGIFILQILQSGFNILSFSPFFKKFIWGVMLLLVMVINVAVAQYQLRVRKTARGRADRAK